MQFAAVHTHNIWVFLLQNNLVLGTNEQCLKFVLAKHKQPNNRIVIVDCLLCCMFYVTSIFILHSFILRCGVTRSVDLEKKFDRVIIICSTFLN